MRKKSRWWVVGGVVFVVLLFVVMGMNSSQVSYDHMTAREIALVCTTDMATQFHIHPNLEINILGKKQEVPTNIGIRPDCMNSLHTHDSTGILHVEAPVQRDFTLSDFFAVWNKPFSKDQIFEHKADAKHRVRITVNAKESTEFESLILKDGDRIVIYYEEIT